MKKIWIYVGLFLSLAVGICSADVQFRGDVKQSVKGMKLYKTELKKMAHETRLEKLHDVMGVAEIDVKPEANIVRTDRFVGINENGVESLINHHGSEIVFTNLPGLRLTEMVGTLPSDQEAVAIALKYLASADLVDLKRGELFVEHVGGLMQALATPRTNSEPEKKAVCVYFNRKIGGFPVMNKGSHITVMIGDSFTPVNLHYHWREVSAAEGMVTESMAVPPNRLKDLIVKDLSRVHNLDQRIIIEKIYPVYYDRGEEYIQPAYCYEGRIISEPRDMLVLGYVPGLMDPPEPVHHPAYDPFTEKPDSIEPVK
jgi:hypothetical protein